MPETTTDEEARKKVWELIKDIKFALLVTHAEDEKFAARPMASVQEDFDGTLWFFTSANSPKIKEIEQNKNVLLSYSKPNAQHYVSVQGKAEILHDHAKIKELWTEAARVWFPDGPEDPEIALLRIDVESAEYWEGDSSVVIYVYGYLKARLTGERPKGGENKIVAFKK